MADNSWGRGEYPLPARLAGLGRFCDALRPKNLIDHKVYPDGAGFGVSEAVHLLTVPCSTHLSIMAEDLKSLLKAGLIRIQSNEPGELTFYFKDKR